MTRTMIQRTMTGLRPSDKRHVVQQLEQCNAKVENIKDVAAKSNRML